MALDPTTPRTRRAILAASLGGLAATAASALGRPQVVRAGSDGDLALSTSNSTAGATSLSVSTLDANGLFVEAQGAGYGVEGQSLGSGSGLKGMSASGYGVEASSTSNYGVFASSSSNTGVYGQSSSHPGVVGHSDGSIGVSGTSPSGTGVAGSSGTGVGVNASSNATGAPAARAWSAGNNTGVLGYSGDSLPTAPVNTGVYGEANQDTTARGVFGKSSVGQAVRGEATSGFGVRGQATSGSGVYGAASSTGYALRTAGRLRFEKVSGVATIAAGTTASTAISPGTDITTSSYVLLTAQSDPGTRRFWATLDTTGNKLTIHTNATSASSIRIAWLLVQ